MADNLSLTNMTACEVVERLRRGEVSPLDCRTGATAPGRWSA
jgi:hypothetical protein